MTTNRVPIERPALTMITPRAIELFAELERAARARRRAVDCTIAENGYCTTACRACRLWFDLHDQIHVALRLRPWQWPCLPRNPYPPGSPNARNWRPGTEAEELSKSARRGAPAPWHHRSKRGHLMPTLRADAAVSSDRRRAARPPVRRGDDRDPCRVASLPPRQPIRLPRRRGGGARAPARSRRRRGAPDHHGRATALLRPACRHATRFGASADVPS